jgi:hypothetical protein
MYDAEVALDCIAFKLGSEVQISKIHLPISRRQIVHFWPANVLIPLHASLEGCFQDYDLCCHRADVLLLKNTFLFGSEICRIDCGKNSSCSIKF